MLNNIEGNKYGSLTVLHRVEDKVSSSGRKYKQYLCKCDCGSEVIVLKDNLLGGKTSRCKNCKTKILIESSRKRGDKSDPPLGSVYGNLTIVEKFYHTDSEGRKTQFYRCRCSCGNIIESAKHSIIKGLTTSCGCQSSRTKLRGKRIEIGSKTDPSIRSKFGSLTVVRIIPPEEGGEKKIECQCDCGNTVVVNKHSLLNGRHKTCGNCPKIFPQWFIDRLVEEKDKQNALEGKLNTQDKVLIKCAVCGKSTYIRPHNILRLRDQIQKRIGLCNECSHHTSSEEIEIRDFILSLGISNEDILQNKLGVIPNRELDFYLPKYKLAIEFNGSYYHAEDRKPRFYHQDKFRLCDQRGIQLISIFEKDWLERRDIIKNILASKLLPTKKLYARNLEVVRIEYSIAKEFFNTYHIQGNSQHGSIVYGLVDKNQNLLSIMSFGRKRYCANENEYEIHRYCTKPLVTIVGGASKLLTQFEKEYKPKELLTYSDNDYFSGNVYLKIGFVFEKLTDPDYYWYNSSESISRENTQLNKLKDKYPELYQEAIDNKASNKEDYIMGKLGAVKVYRSGSKRWVKRY